MSRDFASLYQDVVFIANCAIEADSFAIITACNPLGRVLSNEANEDVTKDLRHRLGSEYHREIIGASPDRQHQELSFAWQTQKASAIKLAAEFLQNAIYWVEDGDVILVPVKMSGKEATLGKFSDFLIVE